MKKYIFVLLLSLLSLTSYSQVTIKWSRSILNGVGVPNFDPFDPNRTVTVDYVYFDKSTSKWYQHVSGTTWTVDTTTFKGLKGDQGLIGPQGPAGSGGGSNAFVDPDAFGATHSNVSPNKDADALQAAISVSEGKTIWVYGHYYLTHGLVRPKYSSLVIRGQAIFETVGSGAMTVIGGPQPANTTESIVMQNYYVDIENLNIICSSNQIGIDCKASSNSSFKNILVSGASWAFRSEFMLQSSYFKCTALSCTNGLYVGIGTFSGATINNSQSNNTIIELFHTHTVSGYGIYIDATYEVTMKNIVIEGNGSIQYGIYYNMQNSTTSKNGELNFLHCEQLGGTTGAWVYVNMRDGTLPLKNIICHYSGLVVDAQSSTGAALILLEEFNYAVGDGNGKYFKSNNIDYQFNWCQGMYPSIVPNYFTSGSNITYCSGNAGGCASNSFGVLVR